MEETTDNKQNLEENKKMAGGMTAWEKNQQILALAQAVSKRVTHLRKRH
jgi:hypothetical protein